MPREGLERKADSSAIGKRERAFRHIDRERRTWMRHEPLRRGVLHDHRQQSVLQGVVVEDVSELGADHGTEAMVDERPRGMLTRRAAAEIAAGDEDPAADGGRLVE